MSTSTKHQAHSSAYSSFVRGENGVVTNGFGRASGKGLRMFMVHAIMKHGPLVTLGDNTDILIKDSWFPTTKARAGRGSEDFTMTEAKTSAFLW